MRNVANTSFLETIEALMHLYQSLDQRDTDGPKVSFTNRISSNTHLNTN